MNPKVKTILLALLPTIILIVKDSATQFTPGSVGATACVAVASILLALEPSLMPHTSAQAALRAGLVRPLAILVCGVIFLVACTPAQVAQVTGVFTDIEVACEAEALATSVIPTGTPAATVAADIEVACNLVDSQLPDIVQVVTAFEAKQASVGSAPPAGVLYTPSPMVKGKAVTR